MRWWRSLAVPVVSVLCAVVINASGSARASEVCELAALEITAKADDAANWPPEKLGPYSYVRLDVANVGPADCVLPGDPQIQLFGPNEVLHGPSWELPPPAAAEWVELGAGDRAYGAVRYHKPSSWGSWRPVWAVVTFADVPGWVFVPWPAGAMSHDVAREERTTAVIPFRAVR